MNDLKPCMFCGGEVAVKIFPGNKMWVFIEHIHEMPGCFSKVGYKQENIEAVIDAWNSLQGIDLPEVDIL